MVVFSLEREIVRFFEGMQSGYFNILPDTIGETDSRLECTRY